MRYLAVKQRVSYLAVLLAQFVPLQRVLMVAVSAPMLK